MFKDIVVAFITPTVKQKAFIVGTEMAKKFGSNLTLVDFIYKNPPVFHFFETKSDKLTTKNITQKARESMAELEKLAKDTDITIKTRVILTDNIAEKVLNYISGHKVDLLIMDHPHLSQFEETFYEDIIHAIHHESHLPVLTLR